MTLWFRKDGRGSGVLKGFLRSVLFEPFRNRGRPSPSRTTNPSRDAGPEFRDRDMSVDDMVRRTLGPRIADSLISSMVHGIYAADSRILSVRSTFPVLWDALQARGSLLLGLLRPSKSPKRHELARAEEEAWNALKDDLNVRRKTWSIYGIRGGVETLTKRLEEEIRNLGVEIQTGQSIERVEHTVDGCRVSSRALSNRDPPSADMYPSTPYS